MYWVLRGCDGGKGDDLDLQREDATIELAAGMLVVVSISYIC